MEQRHELDDAQWERLRRQLPPEKPLGRGRPNQAHRRVVEGIRWRLRTGAPWRDVPERYGKWQTLYSRFRRWRLMGVWARVLAALQAEADAQGALDWSLHFLDGSSIRAHQHAAGAKKGAAIKPLDAVGEAGAPSSICAPTAAVSRWSSP